VPPRAFQDFSSLLFEEEAVAPYRLTTKSALRSVCDSSRA
jgi:hypothetical protein